MEQNQQNDIGQTNPNTSFVSPVEPDEDLDVVSLSTQSEDFQYNQRSATIFLIDFRRAMFDDDGDGYYFKKCIVCCRSIMLNLGRKQHKNYATGIVIFGTSKSSENFPPNVAEVQPLDTVSVERIKFLEKLIKDDFKELKSNFQQHDSFSLAMTLNCCVTVIKKWKQKAYKRNIILFTSDDEPYKYDVEEAHKARKIAEDLSLMGVDLNLVPFGAFDLEPFYKELVLIAKDVPFEQFSQAKPTTSVEQIIQNVEDIVSKYQSHYRKLNLGSGRDILVMVYRIYSEPKKAIETMDHYKSRFFGKTPLRQDEREDVVNGSEENSSVPGTDNKMDVVFSNDNLEYNICGRTVTVSKADINWSKLTTGVGYKLIGFTGTHNIPEYWTVKNPYFMLPYDKDPGGADLWGYLYLRCRERGLSMLCWYQFHKNSRPAPVVLTPRLLPSSTGESVEGMAVTFLPYLDNLIELDDEDETQQIPPSDDQMTAAKAIVNKLNIRYKVGMFHDVEYSRTLAMMEGLAFDYLAVEETKDDTVVDQEAMDRKLGEDVIRMFTTNPLSGSAEEPEEEDPGPSSAKRRKKADELTHLEIIDMIKNGQATKLTMKQLKDVLKEKGVKSLSIKTKPQLISCAIAAFGPQ